MRRISLWVVTLVACLALAVPVLAAKPPAVCGDGKCNRGETADTCPTDCGAADTAPTCVTLDDVAGVDAAGTKIFAKFKDDDKGNYCADEAGVFVNLEQNFKLSIDPKKATRHLELVIPTSPPNGICPGTEEDPPCTIMDVLGTNTGNLAEYTFDGFCKGGENDTSPCRFASECPDGACEGVYSELGELDFQAMLPGDQTFAGLRINFPSDSKSTAHQVLFGGQPFDCLFKGGTAVSVVRGDLNTPEENTWTFTGISPHDKACLLEVEAKKPQRVFKGIIPMPFKMTVVVAQ